MAIWSTALYLLVVGWVIPEAVDVMALTYMESTRPALSAPVEALAAPHAITVVQQSVASYRKSRDFFVVTLVERLTEISLPLDDLPVVASLKNTVMYLPTRLKHVLRRAGQAVLYVFIFITLMVLLMLIGCVMRCFGYK